MKNKNWSKVYDSTPPSNVELLVKSPKGVTHLSCWRPSYNIFDCQEKHESSDDWIWMLIPAEESNYRAVKVVTDDIGDSCGDIYIVPNEEAPVFHELVEKMSGGDFDVWDEFEDKFWKYVLLMDEDERVQLYIKEL